MAPVAISPERSSEEYWERRPTVYFVDDYDPVAISRAKEVFNVVLPDDPGHENWRQAKYLLVKGSSLSAEDIESCPNLVAIGKQGVGIEKIDAGACLARGIKIFNTPGVNARAVAELVLTLSMALAREIRPICLRMDNGEVVPKSICNGILLHKCTIGILGMGNIGKTVANIFRGAFESKIVAYDPYMHKDAWSDIAHKRVNSIEDVLRQADVVSIHIPLTAETRDLISYPQMKLMKSNAILINTSRGGIVNEQDLCRALDENLIWGAGLDCHEQEPPTKERYDKLWRHPNVLSLPHIGARTAETQRDTAVAAVNRLYEYAKLSLIGNI